MASPSSPSSEISHGATPTPPTLANGKASPVPPKVTGGTNVELSDMGTVEDKLPLHEDIMQLARLGEIGPIQILFETGKFNAKYKDQEDITPLHVSQNMTPFMTRGQSCSQAISGLRSTIIMRSVNTSSSPGRMSMRKAASPLLLLLCGLYSGVTSISSICCLTTAQTLFLLTGKATTCFILQHLMGTYSCFSYFSTKTFQSTDQIPQGIHA